MLSTRAPAKINLTLHILGRRADGYHELESLVAFTGWGDRLQFEPAPRLSLDINGPTATAAGAGPENLVLRVARNLAERVEGLTVGAFTLAKQLPVAAGIGGGSSDAAAALRLLARANALAPDDPRLLEAARATGADVPVCLRPCARIMSGVGEILGEDMRLPALPAVLVNPGVAVGTRSIFERLAVAPEEATMLSAHPPITPAMDAESLWRALSKGRNDLEDAAGSLAPVIVDVLAVLRAAKGSRLARMSGSGSTCFALFSSRRAAVNAAKVIRSQHADWWVRTAMLR